MKKIDVLWLVEHKAREMDLACAVKSLVQAQYGIEITIQNMYFHARDVMRKYVPELVVFPYFYRASDAMVKDFIHIWPGAIHFNLAMEQVHYKAHLTMKAPGDDFTRQRVIHHAWGDFYKNYLVESGVPSEHIFVNGNPVYQLYKKPYSKYFMQRAQLAKNSGIDPEKKWVFIPENYKWAFFSDAKLQSSAKRGGNLEEHMMMRSFCRESLAQLLEWCNVAGKNDELEIIFRPRPATNSQQMEDFFTEHVGVPAGHLHFTKAETVREWILASDVVISSYSTSLIESAIAGKSIYMVEPIPIPESLSCDWYELVPRLHSRADFEQACLTPTKNNNCDLQGWAENAMLSTGDPIQGLADFIVDRLKSHRTLSENWMNGSVFANNSPVLASAIARVKRRSSLLISYSGKSLHSLLSVLKLVFLYIVTKLRLGKKLEPQQEKMMLWKLKDTLGRAIYYFSQGFIDKDHFNPVYFENDIFTEVEVHERVEKWSEILVND
jgi:surface carbohydrate biosynthesis protein